MSRYGSAGGIVEVTQGNNGNGTTKPPGEGEQTGRQITGGSPIGHGHSFIGGGGFDGALTGFSQLNALAASCGVGGGAFNNVADAGGLGWLWAQLFGESYSTYRFMRTHATVALAREIVVSPLRTATYTVEPTRENVPNADAMVRFARDEVVPAFVVALPEIFRGLDNGHAKFEQIWRYRTGFWGFERLKSLAVDGNLILVDEATGNFAGIRPIVARPGQRDDLKPIKSWVYTYDGEAGDLRGRSRMENFRATHWADYLKTLLKLDKLRDKISGILPIFFHPPGGFEEPEGSGNYKSYAEACAEAAESLMRGDYVTIETLNWKSTDLRNNPDLAKLGLTTVQFYDAGSYAPAQDGMIKNLEYDDKLIMRGYLLPERVALEAKGGTRADAEQHSTTGTAGVQSLGADICTQFSRGALDEALVINFGPEARGMIDVKMSPLVNAQAARNERIITALIKAGLAPDIARTLDVKKMLETMDAPTLAAFVVTMVQNQPKPGDPGADDPADTTDGGDAPDTVAGD